MYFNSSKISVLDARIATLKVSGLSYSTWFIRLGAHLCSCCFSLIVWPAQVLQVVSTLGQYSLAWRRCSFFSFKVVPQPKIHGRSWMKQTRLCARTSFTFKGGQNSWQSPPRQTTRALSKNSFFSLEIFFAASKFAGQLVTGHFWLVWSAFSMQYVQKSCSHSSH